MRWLLRVVVVVALLWAGYWVLGSRALDQTARQWFDDPANSAAYQSLGVAGFPNRFDLTVTEPRFTDPGSGLEWSAPFLQLFTLTYQPWHIIAAFPPEQRLDGPGGSATLRAEKLQASLVLQPSSALPLDRMTMIGDTLTVEATGLTPLRIENLRLGTRPSLGSPNTHEVGLTLTNVTSDAADRIETLHLDAIVSFSAPLNRFMAQSRPEIKELELRELKIDAGEVRLTGTGALRPDTAGFASGTVALTLTNWEQALLMAAKAGLIRQDTLSSWTNAGRFLASQSPDPLQITLEMAFSNGVVSLAGLPLGPAPRLAITGF